MILHPRRQVEHNQVISRALPRARIQVGPHFTSVGGASFLLYGVAHAEQHLFVDADEQRSIQRLLWVQFEGYLPDNQHFYRYPPAETLTLGPCSFLHDAHHGSLAAALQERPDSDLAQVASYLQACGYQLGDEAASIRFVHLIGEPPRDELMIIYLEDLRRLGVSLASIQPEAEAAARWPQLAQTFLERARTSFTIMPY